MLWLRRFSAQSVDLVADPATTRGLFEEMARAPLAGMMLTQLKAERPDLVGQIEQTEQDSVAGGGDRPGSRSTTSKHAVARRLLAEFHLPDPDTAQGWARAAVSPRFMEWLLATPDEQAMREMIEDRAKLLHSVCGQAFAATGSGRPLARDQHQVYGAAPRGTEEFMQAIT